MHEVSIFRLYVLRAMYLFTVVGLAIFLWPGILNPARHWTLAEGQQSSCMLAAFSLLGLLGLRYPLHHRPPGKLDVYRACPVYRRRLCRLVRSIARTRYRDWNQCRACLDQLTSLECTPPLEYLVCVHTVSTRHRRHTCTRFER
jgi:hypothetical protein